MVARFFFVAFFIFLTEIACCENFYWVGGDGRWGDIAKWSRTSGVVERPDRLPGEGDRLFFDTDVSGTVEIDMEVETIGELTVLTDRIFFSGGRLKVAGSVNINRNSILALTVEMNPGVNVVSVLKSTSGMTQLIVDGDGTVDLQTDLKLSSALAIRKGTLRTNSRALSFQSLTQDWGSVCDFGQSFLTCRGGGLFNLLGHVTGDYSVLLQDSRIFATASVPRLIVAGHSFADGNLAVNTLEIKPGGMFEFYNVLNVTGHLHAVGEEDNLVFIGAWNGSTRMNCTGSAEVKYAVVRNVENLSAVKLTATQSVDMGNNFNWIFDALPSQTYYWKGGDGDWTDVGKWTTDAAGTQPAKRLPTAVDDVIFHRDGQMVWKSDQMYNVCRKLTVESNVHFIINQQVLAYGDVNLLGNGTCWNLEMWSVEKRNYFVADNCTVSNLNMNFYRDTDRRHTSSFELKSPVRCGSFSVNGLLQTHGLGINSDYISWTAWSSDHNYLNLAGSEIITRNISVTCDSIVSQQTKVVAGGYYYREYYNYSNYQYETHPVLRDFIYDQATVSILGDTLEYVVMKNRGTITSESCIVKLELLPDCDVSIAGKVHVREFIAEGKPDRLIKISNKSGGAALVLYGGNRTASYCLIDSVDVENGVINAVNSLYYQAATGWNVTEPLPSVFYWTGGSGRWSDINHWSTTSGGTVKQSRMPMPCDEVVIDAQSGLSANAEIQLDLINNCAGDLQVKVPCRFKMGERGRKLNVSGTLMMDGGVTGKLYELWLWGKEGQESEVRLGDSLNMDLFFQLGNDYRLRGSVHSGYFTIYAGKMKMADVVMDVICFKTQSPDTVLIQNSRIDVADWWGKENSKLYVENTVLSCYPRRVSDNGLIIEPGYYDSATNTNILRASFQGGTGGRYDRLKAYGSIKMKEINTTSLYIAPHSSVVFDGNEVSRLDSLVVLGCIESRTRIVGGQMDVTGFVYLNGVNVEGTQLQNRTWSAWFSQGYGGNINFEPKSSYSESGVQLLEGKHICNIDTIDLTLPPVVKDEIRWFREDEYLGITDRDTIGVARGGVYYCSISGKIDTVGTNRLEVLQEHDFKRPDFTTEGETARCRVVDEAFRVEIMANNTDTQVCREYRWYHDGNRIADEQTSVYTATDEGCYTVELCGIVCKNIFDPDVCLRVVEGPPDAGLMSAEVIPLHCPGDTVTVGINRVAEVYFKWRKDGLELEADSNRLVVTEDGLYAVTIGNICGPAEPWTELDVRAVVPPVAPVQEDDAFRCGPGDIEVHIGGTNGNRVSWYDQEQELLQTNENVAFVYPKVESSCRVYVCLVDIHGCKSDKTGLDLVVHDVAPIDLGGDRSVRYRESFLIEPLLLPEEGSFQWTPCDNLSDCTVRTPEFISGTNLINRYVLEYTSPEGCVSSDSMKMMVIVDYQFPVLFTPNSDGHNDTWKIYGLELSPELNHVWIYNRAGKKIYEAAPYRNDWDGKSDKGDLLPPGTYVYKFSPDGELMLSGMVSLIRK